MLHVNFKTYNSYVTDSLYQWDINQDLIINGLNLSAAPEIHFANANMDRAIVRQSTLENGVITVRIPNSLLQEALTIKAYVGLYEGDTFKVVETIEVPIIAKARPYDYVFENTDGEIYSFNALEYEINALKDRTYAKNEIITNETRNLFGLAADSVPDDMFKKVNEVMSNILSIANLALITYTGDGTWGEDHPCSVNCPFKPALLVFVNSKFEKIIYCDKLTTDYVEDTSREFIKKSEDGLTISWYQNYSVDKSVEQYNQNGVKYYVLAIG